VKGGKEGEGRTVKKSKDGSRDRERERERESEVGPDKLSKCGVKYRNAKLSNLTEQSWESCTAFVLSMSLDVEQMSLSTALPNPI
jgi:hypothetical protein